MTRREFMDKSVAAVAGISLLGCEGNRDQRVAESQSGEGSQRAGPIGLAGVQLYTVRASMEVDVRSTLQKVAEIGYREVEFAGYFGHSPATIRGWLQEFGLTAPASHISYGLWTEDSSKVIADAVAMGHEHVLVPGLPDDRKNSLDDYRIIAEEFNQYGKACADAGVKFGYHNHEFEFTPIDGVVPYDILVGETDPVLVDFEMDLFWTIAAKRQPAEFFEKYPGRFSLCHVKDRAADGAMVDVGAGQIDFAAIFSLAGTAGLKHFFVEHDSPSDGFASISSSYLALNSLLG